MANIERPSSRHNTRLKSYARYDGSGRIVPGSNILAREKPKSGNWVETLAYECCDPFTTGLTTTLTPT